MFSLTRFVFSWYNLTPRNTQSAQSEDYFKTTLTKQSRVQKTVYLSLLYCSLLHRNMKWKENEVRSLEYSLHFTFQCFTKCFFFFTTENRHRPPTVSQLSCRRQTESSLLCRTVLFVVCRKRWLDSVEWVTPFPAGKRARTLYLSLPLLSLPRKKMKNVFFDMRSF